MSSSSWMRNGVNSILSLSGPGRRTGINCLNILRQYVSLYIPQIQLKAITVKSVRWQRTRAYSHRKPLFNPIYLIACTGWPDRFLPASVGNQKDNIYNKSHWGPERENQKVHKIKAFISLDDAVKKTIHLSFMGIKKKWTMPISNWGLIMNQLMLIFENRIQV